MSACEKCWQDAYTAARLNGTSQEEEYQRLLQANLDLHGGPWRAWFQMTEEEEER